MKKLIQTLLFCTLFCLSGVIIASAQQKKITGTVKDNAGMAVVNASVRVKGTTTGIATDADGNFSITVNGPGAVLEISSVSFKTKEMPVGPKDHLDIVLETGVATEQEVVVTALGIKRERKSLGYAVQEVKGQALADANEPNLINAMTGKVAGLQVIRSSNGPAGSSKIRLRGNNSLTGDNQPLIVVDGIPLSNFGGASNTDFDNPSLDMGNGLADINPEDIESMTTLKGPTAAALYGSRAGNGVIMITTKSGRAQKGLGITVTSTTGLENIFTRPKMQNQYGQGDNGIFDAANIKSWGPKADGQTVTDWRGQQTPLHTYDNVGNYLDQGLSSNQGVSFQQQMKSTSIYTSFNRLDDKGIIPGAKLTRTNLTARAVSKFGKDDRWVTDTKVQYINSDAKNRPANGKNLNNIFSTLYQFPRSLDIRQLNPPKDSTGAMRMVHFTPASSQLNPYWSKLYNLNEDVRDRFLLNGSIKYNFNPWLNVQIQGGTDKYSTTAQSRTYAGSPAANGYSLSKETFTETDLSALVSGHKDNLIGKLGGSFTAGGNLMSQDLSRLKNTAGALVVPDLFSLTNVSGLVTVDQALIRKKINSVYGTLQLNWDGYLFLDGTFRNDWTSTLAPANRSYFYPSASLSYVISDMITNIGNTLPSWLSYAKVRGSFATVGNDMNPYQLYNTFTINRDPLTATTAQRGDILFDPNVKNELIKSYEAGAEMRFFQNRFGFDLTVYKSNATNQLINLPLDPLSGYKSMKINAGNIQNTGIELVFDAKILRSTKSDGLNWNLTVNASHNNNTVKYIYPGVDQYSLGGFDKVQVVAAAGQKYGEIYGNTFLRVKDPTSPDNGKILLDANGLPQLGDQNVRLGNQQATALVGITNSFSYKNFNLSFLIDGSFGGKMFSSTLALMQANGTAATTVVNGGRTMVADGVVDAGGGKYEKNTKSANIEDYWKAVFNGNSNLGVTEANLYDASNIRLRNLSLNYNLAPKVLSRTPFQRAMVGLSCNNVWMISSHMHGLDPESVYAASNSTSTNAAVNAVGFENSSAPTTRTIYFNLTLGF